MNKKYTNFIKKYAHLSYSERAICVSTERNIGERRSPKRDSRKAGD